MQLKDNLKKRYGVRKGIPIIMLTAAICLLSGCSLLGEKEPGNLALGMQSVEALSYEEAIQYFEKALTEGGDLQSVYRGLGLAYMGLTQYEEAIAMFEKALAESGGSVGKMEYDISYYLATAEYKNGNVDGALETYQAITALRPEDAGAYMLKGAMELQKGLRDEAVKDFDQAVALDSQNHDLYIKIYQVMADNGYAEDGKAYLNQAMESSEKINEYQKGRLYYYLGNYEEARNALEQAREVETTEAISMLGKTYEALNDINYAASLYSSFLEKNPDNAFMYNQLGLCKLKMEDYQGALAAFQSGIALEDTTLMQSLKYNEIVAYEYLADFNQALVLMESYLFTYPDDESARREYEFLKTR